jgi:hypothetical protein
MTREGAETFLRGLPTLTAAERASDTVVLLKSFAESWLALESELVAAREQLKKARELLRIVGDQLPDDYFKRRNAFLARHKP